MEFCENCGSMLTMEPGKGELICPKCGLTHTKFEPITEIVRDHSKDKRKIFTVAPSEQMPTIPVSCSRCDNKEAYIWTQTVGFGITEQVQCYRCTKCGYTWR